MRPHSVTIVGSEFLCDELSVMKIVDKIVYSSNSIQIQSQLTVLLTSQSRSWHRGSVTVGTYKCVMEFASALRVISAPPRYHISWCLGSMNHPILGWLKMIRALFELFTRRLIYFEHDSQILIAIKYSMTECYNRGSSVSIINNKRTQCMF